MNILNYKNDHQESHHPHNSTNTTTNIAITGNSVTQIDHHPIIDSCQLSDYLCGFGAAIVNVYATFPINKLIFRQMLHGQSVRKATATLRSEGIGRLYRGIAPPLIQRSITLSIMFGTFGTYHSLLDHYADQIMPSYARFCLSAFLAGSTEAIMCPLERVQMLLQDDRLHNRYANTVDAFKKLHIHGIKEYYRGLTAIILRNGPSNILFFTFRNKIKNHLPQNMGHHESYMTEMIKDFISGSIVGALISTLFYPLNVVRTRMQTQSPGAKHLNIFEAAIDIYNQRDRNLRRIFRGVHINYSRSFLSWGIVNACYELFHKLFFLTNQHNDDHNDR
ncbi:hypothetical protein DERF_007086 [Dermatophagoides farinae]|uniref:Mitochondrial carrier triple repeat protein 1-like protein n=1 Tax=Dermatophagoides farinae TaxID=6954 RepID=A0A922I0L6_DERFA|nr:mitochondrial nicotinamide adenine dinucleotide transporter SLC25A51-like [Dermatophagoides farinae]KAH7646018.1 mitochondrial carrier triple repeat protein 1-like protein [Dermatophagoides farinae]KAH9516338.1 hypothetical protein DERF_007086 [Dermatophagoides farinae]